MSVTESKAKSPAGTTKKTVKPAAAAALKAALDAAQIEMVPLSALVKSPMNVRTVPYPVESVRGLADTIMAVGLIQNLVVHTLPDGLSGVAAGGRRLAALQLLLSEKRIDNGYPVIVKRVSDELAVVASMVENNQRAAMHPADQIAGCRTLSELGKTPAQIGDQLGYAGRHVQRMLKLANLAPELITLLAEDKLDVGQCQALSLESDQARQVEIYQRVKAQYSQTPAHLLKRAVTDTEISVCAPRFVFVGREMYEAAGGVVREDLFSAQDGDGTADSVLVDRLVQEKLDTLALAVQLDEGWSWSLARETPVKNYGEDRTTYLLLPEPAVQYTADEQQRLDELYATQEATETFEDEAAIQVLIDETESAASARAWTAEHKAASGVVVSLNDGELHVQRGVQKKVQEDACASQNTAENSSTLHMVASSTPDAADEISLPLLTKMSSERILAVQAALMQQTPKAVALLAWTLCGDVFKGGSTGRNPLQISLNCSHYSLCNNAPSGQEGAGYVALMAEGARLEALLPEGWRKDFTTFFTLDGQTLLSLLGFCVACSVNGVQTRECGHTSRSPLDALETALEFHLRDWWQPTKANFFSQLKHAQITGALNEAGATGVARDAEKMKKGDAAESAESHMAENRWVPVWMRGPDTEQNAAEPESVPADTDTVNHTAEAA